MIYFGQTLTRLKVGLKIYSVVLHIVLAKISYKNSYRKTISTSYADPTKSPKMVTNSSQIEN